MLFLIAWVGVVVVVVGGTGADSTFNGTWAKALMQLNTASLCPAANIASWNCTRCNGSMLGITTHAEVAVVNLPKDQLLGMVVKSHEYKSIILVARGTVDSDVLDWLDDAEFWQKKLPLTPAYTGALVHHGFYEAWNKLRAGMYRELEIALQDPATQSYGIVATGHSLGASISGIMTAELLAGKSIAGAVPPPPLLPRPFVQYTFGEPRTGNQPFASAVASAEAAYTAGAHTWRVVNKKDIVPHLPLEDTFGVPYWHQSQEVWLAPNGTTIICDPSGEDKECSDSIPLLKTHPADHTSYYGWNAGPCNV